MPGIEHVVESFGTSFDAMKEQFGTKPEIVEAQIASAKNRLAPISYSLDVAWQQRLQSFTDTVVNDPTRGMAEGPDKLLLKALDGLDKTRIDERLKDWLVEADPFKESPDRDAIAASGAKLLTALESCFEVAASRADMHELQPDLMAMTDVVRTRMTRILDRTRPNSPAVSVPHQMFLELQAAISRPMTELRAKVRAAAERVDDDPDEAEEDWQSGVQERINTITRLYPDHPTFYWAVTYEKILPQADSLVDGRNYKFTKIFQSRDLQTQMNELYAAINRSGKAENYVARIREVAWPVQETISHYLDAINREWGSGKEDLRQVLEQTLCALADRVLKEVNFLISSRLARSG